MEAPRPAIRHTCRPTAGVRYSADEARNKAAYGEAASAQSVLEGGTEPTEALAELYSALAEVREWWVGGRYSVWLSASPRGTDPQFSVGVRCAGHGVRRECAVEGQQMMICILPYPACVAYCNI